MSTENPGQTVVECGKAAGYINDNDTIFIGPGTTTEMVLKYIKTKNNIDNIKKEC